MVDGKIDFDKIEEEEKPKKWTDFYDIIKTIKNNNFGWNQIVLGKDKETGHFILRLRKARQNFSIKSEKHLQIIQDLLNKGAEELGWASKLSNEELSGIIEEKESVEKIKKKSKKQIENQKEMIKKLLNQVGQLREQQLSIDIDGFKVEIKEFESLLKNNDEKELQKWLFDHPWVFGPSYLEGSREVINREGDRIDFLLQRYDTYYDVIELKLPNQKLFLGEADTDKAKDVSRKFSMSAKLKDAISQVIGYLEMYELDKTIVAWKDNKIIHKPKGMIVIGLTKESNKRALKSLNSYLHDIEIVTYNDIIGIAKNFIKLIENRNKNLKNLRKKK